MIKLLSIVKFARSIPEKNIKQDYIGTVVFVYEDGENFEVEFVDDEGWSAVETLNKKDLIKVY